MPCDTTLLYEGQTLQERFKQVESALQRLERYLQTGSVRVNIGPNGAVAFQGWKDRDGLSDVCAFRSMSATNSFALRQAVMKAEQMSGRKVNPTAIQAGWHSHDGKTWGRH